MVGSLERRRRLGGQELAVVLPHDVVDGSPECRGAGRVDHQITTLAVLHEDRVGGPLDDRPDERVALSRRLLRPAALHELTDLTADRLGHLQEGLVGLLDRAAEELHDPQHLARDADREGESTVQSLPARRRHPGKVRIVRNVADPCRLARGPDAPWKPGARRQRDASRHRLELGDGGRADVPELDTAHHLPPAVDDPDGAHLPSERLGNGLEDARGRLVEGGRLGEDARRHVLDGQAPLASLACRQVAHDAGEEVPAALGEVTERYLERDQVALLVQAGELEGLPGHAPLGRQEVTLDRLEMAFAQVRRHEDGQRLPGESLPRIAEGPFGRPVGKQDRAVLVDRDDRVRRRLRQGPIELPTREGLGPPATPEEQLERVGGGGLGVAPDGRLLKLGRSFRSLRHAPVRAGSLARCVVRPKLRIRLARR